MLTVATIKALTLVGMGEHTPGTRLRELRERLGLSLRQAAQRAETISYGAIRQMESRVGSWERVEIGSLVALSRAYGIPLDRLVRFVFFIDDAPDIAAEVMKKPDDLEVHPEWIAFPAYPAKHAGGAGTGAPIKDKVAYIPREHIVRAGARADNIRVFFLDGECLVSEEAQRISKSLSVGDYVAIDSDREPVPGEVVASWCGTKNVMVFQRYGVDGDDTLLRALADRREPAVQADVRGAKVLGPVIWRGG